MKRAPASLATLLIIDELTRTTSTPALREIAARYGHAELHSVVVRLNELRRIGWIDWSRATREMAITPRGRAHLASVAKGGVA